MMTGPQLKQWRLAEGLSARQVAEQNFVGQVTQSTVSRWENSPEPIPAWATERLLSSTRITLPLHELQSLLDLAREQGKDFRTLLAEAIRHYLAQPTSLQQLATLNEPETPYNVTALPPQDPINQAIQDAFPPPAPPQRDQAAK